MHRILLVDPNRQTREKNRELLNWSELGFVLEDGPIELMSISEIDRYALVLIHMEDAETYGIRLCARIREGSLVPIVLIGGRNEFELARKALIHQVSDYLPSPLSPAELAASLLKIKRSRLETDGMTQLGAPSAAAGIGASMGRGGGVGANLGAGMGAGAGACAQAAASGNIIERVKEYVEESLHQNITLKEISNILHFNCSYLGQKFRIQENMTFNEYLLRQRMERAKYLLEHTDMRVYEIAGEVGYSETDWFYKKFKAYTGVSANEYRKLCSITA